MNIKLTHGMLDAIETALTELLAGEGPQGVDSDAESMEIMRNAERAQEWIDKERQKKRTDKKQRLWSKQRKKEKKDGS